MTTAIKRLELLLGLPPPKGTKQLTRCFRRGGRGKAGRLTGGTRVCRLEGCGGLRIGVRWPDGTITWPCVRGMRLRKDGQYQIV